MMRSLFAGVSALRNHQIRMDVIGNNIANVNTVGYKASSVTFKEQLAQTLRGAGAPQSGRGGTNPQQIGLGVDLGAITSIHTPGNLESTGVESDLAIEGNGFFILSDGVQTYYTRSGVFDFGPDGSLVSLTTGMRVLGYPARDGQIETRGGLQPIEVPLTSTIPPRATTEIALYGNLQAGTQPSLRLGESTVTLVNATTGAQAQVTLLLEPTGVFGEWELRLEANGGTVVDTGARLVVDSEGRLVSYTGGAAVEVDGQRFDLLPPAVGSELAELEWSNGTIVPVSYAPAQAVQRSLRVIDSRGEQHDLFIIFEKVAENEWSWRAETLSGAAVGSGSLRFDTSGRLVSQTGSIAFHPPGAAALAISPDFSGITQYHQASDITKSEQNGYTAGTLTTLTIDSAGRIHGVFSNGLSQTLAQLALAVFANPAGLLKAGGSTFSASVNSGEPDIGFAGTGARGTIRPGALEMSNVDLSTEFTNMIVTQRGFQANSRVITASDEMLQELVNLKR